MGYQKISEITENRMREFITKFLKGEAAKRGRRPGWEEVYTFDEALSELLRVVGF